MIVYNIYKILKERERKDLRGKDDKILLSRSMLVKFCQLDTN